MEGESRHRSRLGPGLRRGVPLTCTVKEQTFGLNAAKLFGVDVAAKRSELPGDYRGKMRMAYLDEGPSPSHRWHGWVAGG